MKKILSIIAVVFMAGFIFQAQANDELVPGYVTNSYGEVYKNSFGECWRDSYNSTTEKKVECGYPPVVTKAIECPTPPGVYPITFGFDESIISDLGKDHLLYARRIVKTGITAGCTDIAIIDIVGHTDSIGSEEYNMTLSLERAAVVMDFLVENGVIADIFIGGAGETLPVADNTTKEGRAENRRVNVLIKY